MKDTFVITYGWKKHSHFASWLHRDVGIVRTFCGTTLRGQDFQVVDRDVAECGNCLRIAKFRQGF